MVKAEEITKQLEAWFGPQETLLQLFIARQGKISSLLVEKGRDRLRKFIEICGFKGFLEKQTALNRFIKIYPTNYGESALLPFRSIRCMNFRSKQGLIQMVRKVQKVLKLNR